MRGPDSGCRLRERELRGRWISRCGLTGGCDEWFDGGDQGGRVRRAEVAVEGWVAPPDEDQTVVRHGAVDGPGGASDAMQCGCRDESRLRPCQVEPDASGRDGQHTTRAEA